MEKNRSRAVQPQIVCDVFIDEKGLEFVIGDLNNAGARKGRSICWVSFKIQINEEKVNRTRLRNLQRFRKRRREKSEYTNLAGLQIL